MYYHLNPFSTNQWYGRKPREEAKILFFMSFQENIFLSFSLWLEGFEMQYFLLQKNNISEYWSWIYCLYFIASESCNILIEA